MATSRDKVVAKGSRITNTVQLHDQLMLNYSDILYRPCLLKSSIEQIYQTPSKQAFWLHEVAGGWGR